MVQTAEGALVEVQEMLGRMVESAGMSANGTYQDKIDQENLQKEVVTLKEEINRIADSTNFNGIGLLDGSLAKKIAHKVFMAKNSAVRSSATGGSAPSQVLPVTLAAQANSPVSGTASMTHSVKDIPKRDAARAVSFTNAIPYTNGDKFVEVFEFKDIRGIKRSVEITLTCSGNSLKDASGEIVERLNGSRQIAAKTLAQAFGAAAKKNVEINNNFDIEIENKDVKFFNKSSGTAKKAELISVFDKQNLTVRGNSVFIDKFPITPYKEDEKFSVTFKFVDINGQTKSSKIVLTYKGGNVVDGYDNVVLPSMHNGMDSIKIAEAFAKAALNDPTFKNNFDCSTNGNNIVLTAKQSGSNVARLNSAKMQNPSVYAKAIPTPAVPERKEYTLTNFQAGEVFEINGKKFVFGNAPDPKDGTVKELPLTSGTKKPTNDDIWELFDELQPHIPNLKGVADGDQLTLTVDATNPLTIRVIQPVPASIPPPAPAPPPAPIPPTDDGGLILQIGNTSDKFNQLTVTIEDTHIEALGISELDVSTQIGARNAMLLIKSAINKVSKNRSTLGAIQNRLEHTSNNISTSSENLSAAESRIRDADIAKEMMSYTKSNILLQFSQAIMAQANHTPEGVLQLLQ